MGESVDDCGGGYSESIAEMCDELMGSQVILLLLLLLLPPPLVPLLIATPNGRDEAGTSRDCFLLNPALKSLGHMQVEQKK